MFWALARPYERDWLPAEVVMRRVPSPFLWLILALLSLPQVAPAASDGLFEHAMWQWYEASGISQAQMSDIAPHFPHPQGSSKLERDLQRYENALLRWTYLYPHEYEAFVNAPELTALNPYYTGQVRVYRRPRFMDVSVTDKRPELLGEEAPFKERLYAELQLMKWIFVFHPETFKDAYGFSPTLPEDIDVAAWRAKQIERARAARVDEEGDGAPQSP